MYDLNRLKKKKGGGEQTQTRKPDGTMGPYEYVFTDEPDAIEPEPQEDGPPLPEKPEAAPLPEKPHPAQPLPANPSPSKEGKSAKEGPSPKRVDQPVEYVEGAGDRLIPFDGTDPMTLIEQAREAAAASQAKYAAGRPRLPFTAKTIAEVRTLCGDPEGLIERYFEKTKRLRRPPRDPDAYLKEMAREARSKRDGVTVAHVKAMQGKDHAERAKFLAAEVEPVGPVKVARPSAELVAHLARTWA